MDRSAQELKISLDQKVKEFIEEERLPLFFYILNDYFELIKKEPLLQNLLADFEKTFHENYQTGGHFENIDEMINLEPVEIKNGKLINNLWFIYGILSEASRGLEMFKSAYTKEGVDGLKKVFESEILPIVPKNNEELEILAPILDKKVFDKYLTIFNNFIVGELITRSYLEREPINDSTYFDETNSLLHLKGEKIKIARKNDETNSHLVLKYIFENKDNINKKHHYSEMHEKNDAIIDQYSWKKYFRACENIQNKIRKDTREKIDDFLIIKSGKSGWVQINSKFL